jgi:NCAIR mutase (PurE)-related protein
MPGENLRQETLDPDIPTDTRARDGADHAPRSGDGEARAFATLDHERMARTGFPEVIFCPGKTEDQIARIAAELAEQAPVVMATRASQEAYDAVRARLPQARWEAEARIIVWERQAFARIGSVAVVSAGTADGPVAAEAAVAAEIMGNAVSRVHDVGVAGLHRVLRHCELLRTANVIIAVAGMDGALPSVIAGLTDRPVVATPTSVGYGASYQGLAALLAMLNACAPGVSVVNIDNGFGAACVASRINHLACAHQAAREHT